MKNLVKVLSCILFFSQLIFTQSITWEQLSGPHGGTIYSTAVDPAGNLYASPTGLAGPYKSTDNGESWFSIKNGMGLDESEFRPLNINSDGILFQGGGYNYAAVIYRSSDGGDSWEQMTNLNTNGGSIICISFDNSNNIYLGTGQGIFRSTDNGETWALFGNFTGQAEAIAFNDSGHIFVGTSYCVSRSTDDGTNWTQLPTGGGTRTVAVAPNGYVYAGCWEGAGILRSTDNGESWTYVYPQTVSVYYASIPFFDNNGDIYFPTWGKGVLKSTDNGDNWTEMNNNLGYKAVRIVAKDMSGNFFTGGYGVYKSADNCESWYSVGLPVAGVSKIVIPADNNIYTVEWGLNRSTDYGQSWQTINNGLGYLGVKALTMNTNGYLFAGTGDNQNGIIFRSTDQGESWARVDSFPTGLEIRGLASGPNGEIVAVGMGYGYILHLSTDDGLTWHDISYGTGGAYSAAINSAGDIFVTRNGGVDRKLVNDTVWTNCSGAGSGSPPVIFIASNGYIYTDYTKSTDNGDTWTTNNFPTFITSYAENSLGHLFIGTSNWGQGVYRSTDYAETWEQINDGLPIMDIHSVAVDDQDYLYAGSWGMSMFKTTTSTLTSVENPPVTPTDFSLEQNYPNPFNPSTSIQYAVSTSEFVTLKVYDVLGNEVATLVNEFKPAGRYNVEFTINSEQLSSGVYFYELKAGGYTAVKKMILMK